jgi:lactoylglutathione lyase
MTELASLVFFVNDLVASARFFRALGVPLEHEAHDDGPSHWAAEIGSVHFAVYQADSGIGTRASGFRSAATTFPGVYVTSLDSAVEALTQLGSRLIEPHQVRPWGCRIIAEDPDGRAVEINQRNHCN